MIRALRLVAGWDPAATSLGAALVGALASFAFLLATGGVGSQPASAALVAVGSAGFGASVGLKAPTLAGRYLRRRELSGALGESWSKLTGDLLKIDDLPELADDPRHQRLIEAYADAFAHFDIDPRYAKERMSEAIELSRWLLDGNLGQDCPKHTKKTTAPEGNSSDDARA
jgi:Fe-S-cluster formation regulator IscX/YfhJ